MLLNVESGIYAILQMTDRSFSSLIEADRARSGISYVATKLERDLRVVLDHLDSEPRPVAA